MPSNDSQIEALAIAFVELAKMLGREQLLQVTQLAASLETAVKVPTASKEVSAVSLNLHVGCGCKRMANPRADDLQPQVALLHSRRKGRPNVSIMPRLVCVHLLIVHSLHVQPFDAAPNRALHRT